MKVLFFLVALLFITAVFASSEEREMRRQFNAFVRRYNKVYAAEEHSTRYANFKASWQRAKARNARSQGAVYGINKFSDLTPDEFRAIYLMPRGSIKHHEGVEVLQPKSATAVPNFLDWRAKGAVTPVKNQEQCGSCWAFSVTENVESQWILAGKGTNSSVDLAPQQIVDCDQEDAGCNGGDPPTAYEYIINAGGLESESAYPYTGEDGSCQFNANKVVAKISNWKYATQNEDEKTLQANLVSWGPLSICVDAANWQDYTSGVMTAWECAWIVQLDHCVELVGYDQTSSTPYWFVRNSWGTDWGVNGYIYLSMFENTCGMDELATTSVI